jgi:hypothetical protein
MHCNSWLSCLQYSIIPYYDAVPIREPIIPFGVIVLLRFLSLYCFQLPFSKNTRIMILLLKQLIIGLVALKYLPLYVIFITMMLDVSESSTMFQLWSYPYEPLHILGFSNFVQLISLLVNSPRFHYMRRGLLLINYHLNIPPVAPRYVFAHAFIMHPEFHLLGYLFAQRKYISTTLACIWAIILCCTSDYLFLLTYIDKYIYTLPLELINLFSYVVKFNRDAQGTIWLSSIEYPSFSGFLQHLRMVLAHYGYGPQVEEHVIMSGNPTPFQQKCHDMVIYDMARHKSNPLSTIFTPLDIQTYFQKRWNISISLPATHIYQHEIYELLQSPNPPSHERLQQQPFATLLHQIFTRQHAYNHSSNSIACLICCDAPRTILNLPCKHLVSCASCSALHTHPTCIICKLHVDQTLSIHVP